MHDEPTFENRLMRYAASEEDPGIARHIAECPDCQDALETMRTLTRVRETTGGTLPELPHTLAASLEGLMPRIRPDLVTAKEPGIINRIRDRATTILSELVLDSGATPALSGLRSGGSTDAEARQLAFVSDVADLDIELTPAGQEWTVTGQLGMDAVPEGLEIRFLPGDADPLADNVADGRTARISGDGYFNLVLPAGDWLATVTMEDATVLFRDISI